MKFSVVIPTLGGLALAKTIDLINHGTCVPDEIIVCIPREFVDKVRDIATIGNVKILATEVKGQVCQRVEGFKNVVTKYIIQLDDDMFVHETCFERLIEGVISNEGKVAIAPAMVFEPGGQSCYQHIHTNSHSMTRIHGKNWFQSGTITRSGMNIGLNALTENARYSEVEWLPGGCVIHKKENLILFDYFPFTGKAFYEDVIHSIHLQKNGVELLVDREAVAGIDHYEPVPFSHWQPFKDYRKYFKYRKHVVQLSGNSILYLLLDGLHTSIITTVGFLKQKIKSSSKR